MLVLVLILLYLISCVLYLFSVKGSVNFLRTIDRYFLLLVLAIHTVVIVLRGIAGHRIPITDTFETLLVFAWLITVVGIILHVKYRFRGIRITAGLAAFFTLLFSTFIASNVQPLMPALRSGWLYFHVGSYFVAYASFTIGFGISLIYIVLSFMKRQKIQNTELLNKLEGLIFRITDIGFPFLTIGLACGSIWASVSWGRFWNWDPKEVWALVTWLVYAGCLHLRHTHNLRGIYAALMAAIGFIAIVCTYIGVNLIFTTPTLHNYS